MEAFSGTIMELVRAHAAVAPPIVFLLAFGESLAFISLLLPATVLLVGGGGIVGAAGIGFWPIWGAAFAGAVIGDWVSYWVGAYYKEAAGSLWPLSRYPLLLPRGEAFFAKWGVAGVFLGRFFGPLRSVMPLVAGICAMSMVPFQIANLASAALWATVVLAPGWITAEWLL